jgi:hypothetical protein
MWLRQKDILYAGLVITVLKLLHNFCSHVTRKQRKKRETLDSYWKPQLLRCLTAAITGRFLCSKWLQKVQGKID